MTPSLMPTVPDAQHVLDPSSMSVGIVTVIVELRRFCDAVSFGLLSCS